MDRKRLYEAAVEGDIPSLHELLGEDPEVLDKVIKINCFDETILHVAILQGHVDFVKEILERKSELAGELDSQLSSPLHLASANGHVEIVKALLLAKSEMCGVVDQDGRNPLHLAAINGRVDVLEELIRTSPTAARAPLDNGKTTIMHLCVQHNQLEALKLLVEKMNDEDFVNSKDEHVETILHLAVWNKQTEMVTYLLSSTRIKVNEVNVNGLTALDILAQSGRNVKDLEIGDSLRRARALRAKDLSSGNENGTIRPDSMPLRVPLMTDLQHGGTAREWVVEWRNMIMLVASLIAALTFQAGINPPGGVWQDDSPENLQGSPVRNPHKAGEFVMVYNRPVLFANFYMANGMGFIGSILTILLLMIALAFKSNMFTCGIILATFLTVVSVLVAFLTSLNGMTPPDKNVQEFNSQKSKIGLILFIGSVIMGFISILAYWGLRIILHKLRSSTPAAANSANIQDPEAPPNPPAVANNANIGHPQVH